MGAVAQWGGTGARPCPEPDPSTVAASDLARGPARLAVGGSCCAGWSGDARAVGRVHPRRPIRRHPGHGDRFDLRDTVGAVRGLSAAAVRQWSDRAGHHCLGGDASTRTGRRAASPSSTGPGNHVAGSARRPYSHSGPGGHLRRPPRRARAGLRSNHSCHQHGKHRRDPHHRWSRPIQQERPNLKSTSRAPRQRAFG